jgi:hypothetical protein
MEMSDTSRLWPILENGSQNYVYHTAIRGIPDYVTGSFKSSWGVFYESAYGFSDKGTGLCDW